MKMIYEEKLILEEGDNQIVLDKQTMEALYSELKIILKKVEY